jgi:hypothetical protein
MLWLKARSLIALGMTTATRNGSAGVSSVATAPPPVDGASVGVVVAAPRQALRTNTKIIMIPSNLYRFFIVLLFYIFYSFFDINVLLHNIAAGLTSFHQ